MMKKQGLYDPFYEHDGCGVGFIANINGDKTHTIIDDGITILANLEHRGAVGGDTKTGDGAGILLQLPHRFFTKSVDFPLPQPGRYGVGFLFLPRDQAAEKTARKMVEAVIKGAQAELLGWRRVPIEPGCLGDEARKQMPSFWQLFVSLNAEPGDTFELHLYILRKAMENEAVKRGWEPDSFYIPSLLAISAVHHYLVAKSKRHLAGLLMETGEALEVHHFVTLIGFGASGINPYLAFETISDLLNRGDFSREMTAQEAIENYITAIKKGILKVMSRMGISTLRSYRGSQIFEAVGLSRDFMEKYFTGGLNL